MIKQILFLITACLCGCTSTIVERKQTDFINVINQLNSKEEVKTKQNKVDLHLDTITISDFRTLKKSSREFLDTIDLKKFKNGDVVNIKNHFGKIVREYSDSLAESDDTEQRKFSIIGCFESIKTIVMTVQYYETGECILVNSETGKETKVMGIPKMSLDQRFLFSSSIALGYDIMPTGFQIWGINDNELKLIHEVQTKTWGITEFFWVGERNLILKARNMANSIYYMKLTF